MRISDARYSRDRLRFDLALRFIQHEARTSTIRLWTGLTDDRIRKLYRSYIADDGGEEVTRHRGKSPQQATFFTRTPAMRQETAVLASVCYLLGVMPASRVADAQRALPGMQRGEAVYLVTALARGDEIAATLCSDCRGLIVVDRYATPGRRCGNCEETAQGKSLL